MKKGVALMSSQALPQGEVKQWRIILFVIIAGLLTLLALYGGIRNPIGGTKGQARDRFRNHEYAEYLVGVRKGCYTKRRRIE